MYTGLASKGEIQDVGVYLFLYEPGLTVETIILSGIKALLASALSVPN